ncbi:MAG: glutathione S-transferase family protein [Hyphomicrobiales bacterium]|nr:glutathione S-transferase family protein [Hyphomicrobiales bacterium]MCP4997629.1 glutathione S-transferase family protein [Hyphomicrobiales bacterium]
MPKIASQNLYVKSLEGLHLYHFWLSSCSQRVRVVMAEKALQWTSHEIDLENQEHASDKYQSIHPDGLVPALVHDGEVFVESIDIIDYLDREFEGTSLRPQSPHLRETMHNWMNRADAAQSSLKLLTHQFLFRMRPMPPEALERFVQNHNNRKLCEFMRVFASEEGFPVADIEAAIFVHFDGFCALDAVLGGNQWLLGDTYSLADIAWAPNVHRLDLMQYPFERHPNLLRWYRQIKERPAYRAGIASLEPPPAARAFDEYSSRLHGIGRGIGNFRPLSAASAR